MAIEIISSGIVRPTLLAYVSCYIKIFNMLTGEIVSFSNKKIYNIYSLIDFIKHNKFR